MLEWSFWTRATNRHEKEKEKKLECVKKKRAREKLREKQSFFGFFSFVLPSLLEVFRFTKRQQFSGGGQIQECVSGGGKYKSARKQGTVVAIVVVAQSSVS